jgi:hypothetical protein
MLKTIERAVDAAMPGGGYWNAYDAKLRAKLERPEQESGARPGVLARIALSLSVFRRPLGAALAGAALLLVAGSAVWFSTIRKPVVVPVDFAGAEDSPASAKSQDQPPAGGSAANPPSVVSGKPASDVPRKAIARTPEARTFHDGSPPAAEGSKAIESAAVLRANVRSDPVVKDHLESVELLLRAIRNSRSESSSPADRAFHKSLASALVTNNAVLRRSARQKGDTFLEELLSQVESPLLDIAHLPARPSLRSVRIIQSVLERGQVIQAVQIYADSNPPGGN